MKYSIFQINSERDKERVKFFDWEFTKKHGGFDFTIYDKVWDGEIDEASCSGGVLSKLYCMFNEGVRPEGYNGHSLSVSDVIVVFDGTHNKFWFVDSFWFEKVGDIPA